MGTSQNSIGRNVAVLAGTITSEPVDRELATGVTVVQFDLSTPLDGESISAPVAWHDPTATQRSSIAAGTHVLVVGSVRRRFFRAGGRTQSRTEVVAATVVPSRRAKSARSALASAAESLTRGGG